MESYPSVKTSLPEANFSGSRDNYQPLLWKLTLTQDCKIMDNYLLTMEVLNNLVPEARNCPSLKQFNSVIRKYDLQPPLLSLIITSVKTAHKIYPASPRIHLVTILMIISIVGRYISRIIIQVDLCSDPVRKYGFSTR